MVILRTTVSDCEPCKLRHGGIYLISTSIGEQVRLTYMEPLPPDDLHLLVLCGFWIVVARYYSIQMAYMIVIISRASHLSITVDVLNALGRPKLGPKCHESIEICTVCTRIE